MWGRHLHNRLLEKGLTVIKHIGEVVNKRSVSFQRTGPLGTKKESTSFHASLSPD